MTNDTWSKQLVDLERYTDILQHDGVVFQYLNWLNERLSTPDPGFVEHYQPIVAETEAEFSGKRPFLSVIMRTQGRRAEMLREALLSLAGQSDEDFEIILIGHKLGPEQRELVTGIIAEEPDTMRRKIRFFELDHGNRTAPLNYGFAKAYGEYFSVLDDDDVVFDHWVASYHEAANAHPGTIIHAYVLDQEWMTVPSGDSEALRAVSAPGDQYCKDYSMVRQLESNWCPLMGVAFPRILFQKYGFIFDESLTTTEDWDFLIRTSALTGVTDVSEPTCLYRLWENAENSKSVHSEEEWNDNYAFIEGKYTRMPVLLPAGQEKNNRVLVYRYEKSLRIRIKEKIREYIPDSVWKVGKFLYRGLGGKKWLGD